MRSTYALAGLCVAASTLLALPAAASDAGRVAQPTAVRGTQAFVDVPAGFDPATASADALDSYGFPPRPDKARDPDGYAAWLDATSRDIVRIKPELRHSRTRNRPDMVRAKAGNTEKSDNWSGYILYSGASSYGPASFTDIHGSWTMPTVKAPKGGCNAGSSVDEYNVAIWVGIDGSQSQDVLQAGASGVVECNGSKPSASYQAWYEWFPNDQVNIPNLPVSPGDTLHVYVWSTSPTQGRAYLANISTGKSASLSFTAPAGTKLQGNSAEWIVERPGVNGALSELADYGQLVMTDTVVNTANQKSYSPGTNKGPNALEMTKSVMTDDQNKPISVPAISGPQSIKFKVRGSAK